MIKHAGTKTIDTQRLILRRFCVEDADAVYRNWANDPEVAKFLYWNPHENAEETAKLLGEWVAEYEDCATYNWAIVLKETGEPVGSISTVGKHDDEVRSCGIGYCMSKSQWGRGIMTEALTAVIKYLFTETDMNRIISKHDMRNPASGGVMKKSGMFLEGVKRKAQYREKNGLCDVAYYAILREDWEVANEIAYYNALPVTFERFVSIPKLAGYGIELICLKKSPAIPEKNFVPAYEFAIVKDNEAVGHVHLRIGYTTSLYYGGQIGYGINEPHRGNGYAEKACRLMAPIMKAHGMTRVLITNNRDNAASRRTCEKLGAKLLRVAELPDWHDLYKEGQRYVNVFEWVSE